MKYSIDSTANEIILSDSGKRVPLYSPEGFRILSDLWVKVGWDQKHLYSFTWLGRPIIQIPDDAFRIQEIIYTLKPDVIVETGVAHGGSLVFYASVCKAIGKGKIVGIDVEIRPHNRKAIESHETANMIELIEGDSVGSSTFDRVKKSVGDAKTVLVLLDSNHTYKHVMDELKLYSQLVSRGSYIVVTDGSQEYLNETPRAKKDYPGYCDRWPTDNPKKAAEDFVQQNKSFRCIEPKFLFNEGNIDFRITHWPSAFLQRIN